MAQTFGKYDVWDPTEGPAARAYVYGDVGVFPIQIVYTWEDVTTLCAIDLIQKVRT